MAKNSQVVKAYLDDCAERIALRTNDEAAWIARLEGSTHDELWKACLDEGWTVPELDAAYERRFGRRPKR